tara:strand:+ start:207 stop:884 length:678 start_codon:yes stop_codon:yes gene_type:complete
MMLFTVLSTGAVAGSLHVVAGPDHLAALAPVAVDDRARAVRLGALWGLGHGLGVISIGLIGLSVAGLIDIDALSSWSEFAVGIMLVGVGGWSLRRAATVVIHRHEHGHSNEAGHHHIHVHIGHVHDGAAHQGHTHAALGIGWLHGAAGAGHVFGVVPALALPVFEAVVYLGAYFVSAVVSMALFGGFLGFAAKRSGPRMIRGLMSATGVAAVGLGVVWSVSSWPI